MLAYTKKISSEKDNLESQGEGELSVYYRYCLHTTGPLINTTGPLLI